MALRRSARTRTATPFEECPSYPDGPAANEHERVIETLNRQTFSSTAFAHVDDILVYAIFATKQRHQSYRALKPGTAFTDDALPASREQGISIAHLFNTAFDPHIGFNLPAINTATDKIMTAHPSLFSPGHRPIILHLLSRYSTFLSRDSPVKIEKVSYNNSTAIGLVAKRDMVAGIYILSACGSISSDDIGDRSGISTIESSMQPGGPKGPRLVLGPFRFANHDCNPNCQMIRIKDSYAYGIVSLRYIESGEPVTISYDDGDGSYFQRSLCLCQTCNPSDPPVSPRREVDPTAFQQSSNKKTRRSGAKHRKRQENRKARLDGELGTEPEVQGSM